MVYLHQANDVRLLWVTFLAYMHQKVGESAGQSGLCVRLLQCSAVSWVPFLGYVTVTVSPWERVRG